MRKDRFLRPSPLTRLHDIHLVNQWRRRITICAAALRRPIQGRGPGGRHIALLLADALLGDEGRCRGRATTEIVCGLETAQCSMSSWRWRGLEEVGEDGDGEVWDGLGWFEGVGHFSWVMYAYQLRVRCASFKENIEVRMKQFYNIGNGTMQSLLFVDVQVSLSFQVVSGEAGPIVGRMVV